jgi:hypothetical protein
MTLSHSEASKWNTRISKLEHDISSELELENVDVSNWQLYVAIHHALCPG